MTPLINQHVVFEPTDRKWGVRTSGSHRPQKKILLKEDAVKLALEKAKSKKVKLYIHSKSGRIEKVIDFSEGSKE